MPNKLKREYQIVKKSLNDFIKMTPKQKVSEGKLQKALNSSPADRKLIDKGRRMDLEIRVNKDEKENKARGSQSSATRKLIK